MDRECELGAIHVVDEVRDTGRRLDVGVRQVTPEADGVLEVLAAGALVELAAKGQAGGEHGGRKAGEDRQDELAHASCSFSWRRGSGDARPGGARAQAGSPLFHRTFPASVRTAPLQRSTGGRRRRRVDSAGVPDLLARQELLHEQQVVRGAAHD
jgi:hypothetical protein